ncbi:MAG: chromosome segregation and condensation protein ScpA [Sphingobacteriales bacterium]|nr:chromosome segregation and condensation protein ScpA [Sphingobacteriales bacterium]
MVPNKNFAVKLPQFEGPFDLLLFFIERDEIDIQDIAIASITNEFLEYLHHLNSLNMEIASEFIFVAATLMRIKARTLLPRQELDENANETDLQQNLIDTLIEYKKFKSVSEQLKVLEENRLQRSKRGNIHFELSQMGKPSAPVDELSSLSLYKLMMAYNRVIQKYDQTQQNTDHLIIQYPYTIENQKIVISNLLDIAQRLDYRSLLATSENKVQFVYNFLAMLEMLQQQLIEIQTGLGFNNFWIELKKQTNH